MVRVGRPSPDELSRAQREFAERMGAHPGVKVEAGAVFLYREDEWGCERWLVDRHGHILEFERFERSEA